MGHARTEPPRPLKTPSRIERDDRPETLRSFASDVDTARGHVPAAVLRPGSSEAVAEVLQWANDSGVGVVPVSSTGRRRRGDTVPQRDRTVMLDLSGMKRLVHADARDKIVIVEPGVDFGTIDHLLKPHGLRALRPLMPRAGKSLIASHLEREPLIAANDHWEVSDPFGGTHLVLGNGKPSPTGTAAMAGSLEEQLAHGHRQMLSVGPANIDFLRVVQGAQGTLAAMTWAAVYAERIPVAERAWFASADGLAPIVAMARDALHRRLGNALFIVDNVQLAMLLMDAPGEFAGLAARLPPWTLFISVCAGRQATEQKMAWQGDDVAALAAEHGARLHDQLERRSAGDLVRRLRQPQATSFRDAPLGAHRELFFVQQLDRVERFVEQVRQTLRSNGMGNAALGVYVQPMAQGVNCHIEFDLLYRPAELRTLPLDDVWQAAAQRCADAGAFFSRPYGRWRDIAFQRDTGHRSMMTMAKSILDPNGVMNPGRLPY
jgi:FAD/FMN-containing dehydrogenase